jgi:anaerobic selenocysteine-containing dehydrogenase
VLPPGHRDVAFEDLTFPTPSGRIELLSSEAHARWGVDALPDWSEPVEGGSTSAGGARPYPLVLLTPNTKNRIHSQFGNLRMIRSLESEPVLHVCPGDADKRGLVDGGRVRVFNARGSLTVPCRVDHGLRAGCVSLTNGWWLTDGAAVNVLSAGRETDMGHGAAFHDNLVEVEKALG